MNEEQWLACTDPDPMLEFLRSSGMASERKFRLFAVTCCQRVERLITHPDAREALAFAKRHAEIGVVRRKGRAVLERAAREAHSTAYAKMFTVPSGVERAKCLILSNALDAAAQTLNTDPFFAASYASSFSCFAVAWEAQVASGADAYPDLGDSFKQPEKAQQSHLLRDLFGNPFRPPLPIAPSVFQWQGATVVQLARAAYEEGELPSGCLDRERLGVLADALEEAGADAQLVVHLRGPGPHVRGCHAIDAILLGPRTRGRGGMNEEQWRTCTDPIAMLDFLRSSGAASERKLRLFAAACCRRAWQRLDAGSRAVVETSERLAEGAASESELMATVWASRGSEDIDARTAVDSAAVGAWRPAVALLATVCSLPPDPSRQDQVRQAQADLLRCVLGPLGVRPPRLDLRWRTPLVRSLAGAAYEERIALDPSRSGWLVLDPARLLVLADALEEAGCPDADLVNHLWSPGPHVRGCFAIDAILERS